MDACMALGVALAVVRILLSSPIFAQQTPASIKTLVTIVTGNKFQQILPENNTGKDRRGLVIDNKNANGDSCWVFVGTGRASKEQSDKVLAPGDEYVEYWPFVPSDEIQATCASSSDTLNVEYQ
ncbi:MAG: hypothetical protein WCA56_06115 [Xanthobacteraceae bacterium]|jgi:hypothetical protein